MNPIPYLFLLVAVVATAVNIFLFTQFGGMQGGGFRPWALALRIVLLVFAAFCVIMAWCCRTSAIFGKPKLTLSKWLVGWVYDSDRYNAISLEWAYQKVQSRVLMRYLVKTQPGKRCVILREPLLKTTNGKNASNPLVDGLREALGGGIKIVKDLEVGTKKKTEPLPPGEEEPVTMGLEKEKWTAADLDDMLVAAGDFDLLICCVNLPEDAIDKDGRFTLHSLEGRKVALLGGYSKEYDKALADGTVVAAVTVKPDCRFDEKDIPEDDRKAFDKRYLLLEGGPRVEPPVEGYSAEPPRVP